MRILLASDLHLTDKARDRYRFGLFKWLAKQQQEYKPDATFILGDLTDSKNHHSAELTNGMVDGFRLLKPPVYVLMGNHDFTDREMPFFKFLSHIPGITFVTEVTQVMPGIWMVPFCANDKELAEACGKITTRPKAVCVHGLFEGAIAETGARLSGLSLSPVEQLKPGAIWAGDIHRPQRVGSLLTYVGAPYHVRFGDDFTPRVLLTTDLKGKDLYYPAPRKYSLVIKDAGDLDAVGAMQGDQVKIEVKLTREGVATWAETKRDVLAKCKASGWEVFGLTISMPPRKAIQRQAVKTTVPQDVVREFCRNEGVSAELQDAGLALIE